MTDDTPTPTARMVPASLDPCLEKREPDEPMFILLGRDSTAPDVLRYWCDMREAEISRGERPATEQEFEHIGEVRRKIAAFRDWRKARR